MHPAIMNEKSKIAAGNKRRCQETSQSSEEAKTVLVSDTHSTSTCMWVSNRTAKN